MSADYPLAEAHFVPRNFMFNSNACAAIVIHKTAGDATPQAIYNTFLASGNPGRSVHYGVGQDGTIWQYVPEALGAGGNCCTEAGYDPFWTQYVNIYGNLNLCTLSIEHCDPSKDNSTPLTPAQQDASFKLVAYLAQKYGIPASHIKTHASIDPQSRARCPGNYPMAELLAYVQQGGVMVPDNWHDDGKTLTAPNGRRVVLGFREYVLNYPGGWPAGNQPMSEEFAANPLEYSNPALGDGQKQCFNWTTLEWQKSTGKIIEAWQGQEIYALLALLAKAQQPVPPVTNTTDAISQLHTIQTAAGAALKDLGAS